MKYWILLSIFAKLARVLPCFNDTFLGMALSVRRGCLSYLWPVNIHLEFHFASSIGTSQKTSSVALAISSKIGKDMADFEWMLQNEGNGRKLLIVLGKTAGQGVIVACR